jgi:hypothetical protein
MRRRFSLGRALAFATLLSLPAVACTDDSPTATGGDLFPGNLPSTFQVVLPADSFFQQLGTFSGFTSAGDVGYQIVANRFDGVLQANTLVMLAAFPTSFNYTQGGTSRSDTLATLGAGSLVARVDTAASTSAGPIQLQLWEVGQAWDPATVSWTMAVDTAGGRVRWTQPGGSRAALLSSVSLAAGARPAGDSVAFALDSLTVQRIARPGFPGLLITATGAQGRVQLRGGYQLRTGAHPRSASPDTVLAVNVSAAATSFIFDPDQPSPPAGVLQVGGIRSARTLLRVDLPRTLPVCRGGTCSRVATRDVTLNEVSLLFTPTAVPGGFRPVGPVPTALRRVAEPELGRRAPLGQVVNEIVAVNPATRSPVYGGASFAPSDSVLAVPLTSFATTLVASDTTRFSLALLSDPGTLSGAGGSLSFGAAWFTPAPRLRIVYTLPARPALP